jgi:hypothetical protein
MSQKFSTEFILGNYIENTNGCWEYQGWRNRLGYGRCNAGSVHRLSYKKFKGEIPKDMNVLHKCDNPPCFNPDHLFLGTNADNIKDCMAKGRWNSPEVRLKRSTVYNIRNLKTQYYRKVLKLEGAR